MDPLRVADRYWCIVMREKYSCSGRLSRDGKEAKNHNFLPKKFKKIVGRGVKSF